MLISFFFFFSYVDCAHNNSTNYTTNEYSEFFNLFGYQSHLGCHNNILLIATKLEKLHHYYFKNGDPYNDANNNEVSFLVL